jgi:GNAT superfamily N-acetyltransferase
MSPSAPLRIDTATSPREVRAFIDVPWRLFDAARHPQWVPPLRIAVRDALDARRNPFYEAAARQLFVARRGDRVVGRVAAIENRAHNRFHGDRVGFFGFFEVADDPAAAAELVDAAAAWLAARGLTSVRGPVSPSTNHECGLLVDGFEEHPMFMTAWNPPYYVRLMGELGFDVARELLAWRLPIDDPAWALPPTYAEHARLALAEAGLTFRDVDLKHIDREVALLWDVYNAAWERNWGFVPMTRREFEHLARDLKPLADQRFAFVAEVHGAPAGWALALPDYNVLIKRIGNGRLLPTGLFTLLAGRRGLRSMRVMALGVKREHRTRSVFALFAHELARRARAAGVTGAEASWVLENNHLMNRPMRDIGGTVYRRWRLYERATPAAAGVAPAAA